MASKKLFLNSADITECLELIDTLPDKIFIDDKHRLKVRLVIESILDNNRQHFGEDKEFHFTISERFNRIHISIEVAGDCYDSTFAPELTDEEKEMLSIHFYGTFSSKPSFRYDHNINKIRLTLKKAKAVKPAAKMGIGIMAGFLFSALGFLSPDVFRNFFLPICNQISNIILGLIKMSVTPVIFLMVINSITECGSVYKIKKLGSHVIRGYLLRYLIAIVVLLLYIFIMFDFTFVEAGTKGDSYESVIEILTGIFPTDYISPFINGNFLQLIAIAVLIAMAALIVRPTADPFVNICKSLADITNQIMEWCCGLFPLLSALIIPKLLWSNSLSMISSGLVHMVCIIVLGVMIFLFFLIIMCKKSNVPIRTAFKRISPVLIYGLLTGSSATTFPKILEVEKSFQVKDEFGEFAASMGMIFSRSFGILMYSILLFYLMVCYNVEITVAVMIRLVLSSVFLAISCPPVNGGSMAVVTILIGMFGLPESSIGIAAPMLVVLEFINCSLKCAGIVTQTVISANALGEIDS